MPAPIDRRGFLGITAALAAGASAQQPSPREKKWEGIFVIMQTPFHENLEIDEESLRREADFLARGRVHGMVWPAGAGETTSISYRERLKFSEAVVKGAAGRTTVLIGVHGVNKFEAMEYARHAEKIGADGLHALGPGDGSTDPDILEDYFTAIASVSRLPLSIQVSTAGMTPEFLMKLGAETADLPDRQTGKQQPAARCSETGEGRQAPSHPLDGRRRHEPDRRDGAQQRRHHGRRGAGRHTGRDLGSLPRRQKEGGARPLHALSAGRGAGAADGLRVAEGDPAASRHLQDRGHAEHPAL